MSQSKDNQEVIKEFKSVVNMTPKQLESWLETEESNKVGYKEEEGDESIGHKSGKRIIELLQKKQTDFTDSDFQHMKKVVSYVRRHLAQRPDSDVTDTNWRYSLMNWGHDPKK
jgi:hypothetical protein